MIIYCDSCKMGQILDNPHKENDGKPDIIPIKVKCPVCGNEQEEKIFEHGPMIKNYTKWYPVRWMEDRDKAANDLKTFKKFADKHGIQIWLEGGTLLGAVREGRLIRWEGDIDLRIEKESVEKIFQHKEELEKLGYCVLPKPNGCAIISKGAESKIDIFYYYFDDEFAYLKDVERNVFANISELAIFLLNLYDTDYKYETMLPRSALKTLSKGVSFIPKRVRKKLLVIFGSLYEFGTSPVLFRIPKKFYTKFAKYKLYDEYFDAVADYEGYFEELYGKDWRIPTKFSDDKESEVYKWKAIKVVECQRK